jgi:hypothetical protein
LIDDVAADVPRAADDKNMVHRAPQLAGENTSFSSIARKQTAAVNPR